MLSAEELHARGVEAINSGRIRTARTPLRTALTRTADDALLGAIEASLAYVEAETGQRDEARRLCSSALDRAGLDAETRGSIHAQRALLSMLAGLNSEAMEEFQVAIDMLSTSPLFLGRAHINRGNLFLQQHEHVRAVQDFESGLEAWGDVAPDHEVAMAQHNLGYARLLAGDLPGALRDMDKARVVLAPLSPVAEATCDQDRAEVLMAAGLVAEARLAMGSAARAAGAARLRRRQGEAELALARALTVDDPREAVRLASRAAVRFGRDGAAMAWQARAEAVRLVALAELGSGTEGDLARAAELVDELRAEGLESTARQVVLASVRMQVRRGRLDVARDGLRSLRQQRVDPLSVRLQSAGIRAELELAAGRTAPALKAVRLGLDDLHAWQSSFGSLDLQTNVVGHGVRLGVRGLELAVGSRSDAVLFEWSERARMLASRIQPVRAPQDPQTVADLAELRTGPAPDREADLRRQVRERAWQHRGSGSVADPVLLADLQAALGEETALVAYVVTADRVVGLVVTDQGTRRHDLGERARLEPLLNGLLPDLDMAASELPQSLAGSVRSALADRVSAVADVLVTPLLADLAERQVVLTPSGVLAGVPWTLLPGLTGRPVVVAQSATSWLGRRSSPLRTGSAGFVAGPRVPRAEAEVTASAAVWPEAPVLTGSAATAAAVSELAGRVDVLHVAAHGRHASENPLFSGLELVDGTWFGYDIDQLDDVPDVVLLSACEVGRSSVRWGEELIGMTAAWLHAGVRCVIASPAAVNDVAAHDALVRVHEALAAGAHPAAALAGTVSAVTTDAAPAPFVCFG